MPAHPLPTPSIVMEWENVRLCGHDRVSLVLSTLHGQLCALRHELRDEPELVVTFNPSEISREDLVSVLTASAGAATWPARLIPMAVSEADGYYEQKNLGASVSSNDIVLFLDSDVLPQSGWLRAMLSPFQQWHVAAIAGSTSVECASLYGRATALFWLLPPPPARAGVQPLQAYFANNLAFRRSLFMRVPFPGSSAYRGQCAAQLRILEGMGIRVLQQTDALTLHPPPPGISGFTERAWAAGTGAWHHLPPAEKHSLALPFRLLLADAGLLTHRIRQRSPALHAGVVDRAAGWLLGGLYFLIKAAGHLSIAFASRRYSVQAPSRSAPSPTGPV